jgi:hypothetical protein
VKTDQKLTEKTKETKRIRAGTAKSAVPVGSPFGEAGMPPIRTAYLGSLRFLLFSPNQLRIKN